MDFSLTNEQQDIKKAAKEFCEKEMTKEYLRWMDENADYPPDDLWKKIGDLGFLGFMVSEKYGGQGLGHLEAVIVMEEFAKASASVALAMGTSIGFGTTTINSLGSEEQKEKYLPGIARGELRWSLALTEPAGGTDILGTIRTTAVPDNEDFIINGQKTFITGAHKANYIITVAITDKEASSRSKALSIFIVDARSPGISMNKIEKVCCRACGANEIFYDDVRVPKKNLLGTLNNGWYDLLLTLNPERFLTAVQSLGISEAVLEDALSYSKKRIAFKKPIGQFMAVQHMLSDIAVDIELARNLIYKCAWLCDHDKSYEVESVMANLFASDRAIMHAKNGMEILGGYGVCMDYDMQRYLRDAMQFPFAPLNNEMCKNFIAMSFGLPRSY